MRLQYVRDPFPTTHTSLTIQYTMKIANMKILSKTFPETLRQNSVDKKVNVRNFGDIGANFCNSF